MAKCLRVFLLALPFLALPSVAQAADFKICIGFSFGIEPMCGSNDGGCGPGAFGGVPWYLIWPSDGHNSPYATGHQWPYWPAQPQTESVRALPAQGQPIQPTYYQPAHYQPVSYYPAPSYWYGR